jgi:hypothetical protein
MERPGELGEWRVKLCSDWYLCAARDAGRATAHAAAAIRMSNMEGLPAPCVAFAWAADVSFDATSGIV